MSEKEEKDLKKKQEEAVESTPQNPEADEETGLFLDDFYNDVLEKILNADKKKEEK